jgi:class 3 adenylate cyclase
MELWKTMEETFKVQKEKVDTIEVVEIDDIPPVGDMKLEIGKWYKLRNLVSLYVDMVGSTKFTNDKSEKASAKMYEMFTGSLVKILKYSDYQAEYIDIKGDGGFALWKGKYASIMAVLAAVTFKTYVEKQLKGYVKSQVADWNISSKMGIFKDTVLVKRIGERDTKDTQYNWAVWAGRPVNLSSKLSSIAENDKLLISEDVLNDISQKEFKKYLVRSCGCDGSGNTREPKDLWVEKTDSVMQFDSKIFKLESKWCDVHGEEFINSIIEKMKE